MPNYQLFVPLHLSSIIYIKKQQKDKLFFGFTQTAASLVLIVPIVLMCPLYRSHIPVISHDSCFIVFKHQLFHNPHNLII